MILIICLTCGFTLRVEGDVEEIAHLIGNLSTFALDGYTCSECGKKAGLFNHGDVTPAAAARLRIVDVAPEEAFAALNGLGIPSERSCLLEDVTELIEKFPVASVSGKNISGTGRCIIDHLVLQDGSKVYFAPSTEGATIYRISRPHSYVGSIPNAE